VIVDAGSVVATLVSSGCASVVGVDSVVGVASVDAVVSSSLEQAAATNAHAAPTATSRATVPFRCSSAMVLLFDAPTRGRVADQS
jgi:hypothetical protein